MTRTGAIICLISAIIFVVLFIFFTDVMLIITSILVSVLFAYLVGKKKAEQYGITDRMTRR